MALVPLIQPPIMCLLTTDKERQIVMQNLRKVSRTEKILFPLIAAGIIALLIPAVVPLMGMFMFGNLMKECGVVGRLTQTAQGALMNIVTIFLGLSGGPDQPGQQIFESQTPDDSQPGHSGFCFLHRRRHLDRSGDQLVFEKGKQNEPPDRFGRGFGRAHGGPGLPGGRLEVQQEELPAHARHGT